MEEKDNNLIEFSDKMNYAKSTLKQAIISSAIKS